MMIPRAGLVIAPTSARATLDAIIQAERQGVPMLWSINPSLGPDPLTFLAVAAAQTMTLPLGTAIVPTYLRHPVVMAAQALTVAALAPGRFRLGVGPSSPLIIETLHGVPFGKPLTHLREYVTVLRSLLDTGTANFDGQYFHVHAQLPRGDTDVPFIPLYVSALRAPAFRLAGQVADGVISWLTPIPYLLSVARPALDAGARAAQRATPRLVAHVPVALHSDRAAVHQAARARLGWYAYVPHYQRLYEDAGLPVGPEGMTEALLDTLVVGGTEAQVEARLRAILDGGIDEVMVTVIPVADEAAENTVVARILAALG